MDCPNRYKTYQRAEIRVSDLVVTPNKTSARQQLLSQRKPFLLWHPTWRFYQILFIMRYTGSISSCMRGIIASKPNWKTAIWYVWFGCLVLGSFLPQTWKVRLGTTGSLHLPLHFAVFMSSGLLAMVFSMSLNVRAIRCLSLIVLALILEVSEARIARNRVEWRDVAADTGGVLAAVLLVFLASRRAES